MVGLETRRQGNDCEDLPYYGEECNGVMQECCETGGVGDDDDDDDSTASKDKGTATGPDTNENEGGYNKS